MMPGQHMRASMVMTHEAVSDPHKLACKLRFGPVCLHHKEERGHAGSSRSTFSSGNCTSGKPHTPSTLQHWVRRCYYCLVRQLPTLEQLNTIERWPDTARLAA